MPNLKTLIIFCLYSISLSSQNDIDAIRYSQNFFGGSSRNKSMAGSFGALGADGSCMAINPAGIGLFKKGEMNVSFGLKFNSVEANHNGTSTKDFKASVPFNGLTLVGAWDSNENIENHHALGLSCNQVANYNSIISINGVSNHKSIMQDILATAATNTVKNLDASYAGLAFETYLLDTINSKYYSFVNTKYNVAQSKTIETSGRNNEWCFNYAYGYKDKLYIGATIGISSILYKYSSVYTERDTKDSIRKGNYDYSVRYYPTQKVGGFNSLEYKESFLTNGTGTNLKLGIIYRVLKFMRLGFSFNSPTIYNLTDTYVYNMNATYDEGGNISSQNPPDLGGKFNYKVKTPLKLTGSLALLYKKIGAINIDYDFINYKQASLQNSGASVFSIVNQSIRQKYSQTSNLRVGAEINIKPMFIRIGYAMYGSPFGETFHGNFVNSFYTGGIGFRKNKNYLDISFSTRFSKENYYMYNPNYVDKTILTNYGTNIDITIGSKF